MKETYNSVEKLGNILENFQAPPTIKASIERRAGLVVARGQLSPERIQTTIVDSMSERNGLPDWNKVKLNVGKTVNNLYRDIKRPW